MSRRSGTPWWRHRSILMAVAAIAVLALVLQACTSGGTSDSASADEINTRRETAGLQPLSDDQLLAAGMTYLPSGEHDPYIMLASGGQSGQMFVIGVPSMRILKEVAVFTPEPWQGWGYGNKSTEEILAATRSAGRIHTTLRFRRPEVNTTASSSSSTTRPTHVSL